MHVLDRAPLALEPRHRRIAVEADHQPVAGARAPASSLTWPGCSRSKQPLVKPMRRPCARHSASRSSSTSSRTRSFPPARASRPAGCAGAIRRRYRRGAALADHDRGAALAARIAGSKSARSASIDGEHRHHRVARARHVAHLHRIGRHVDRRAAAPRPAVMPSSLQRDQHRLAADALRTSSAAAATISRRSSRRGDRVASAVPCGSA